MQKNTRLLFSSFLAFSLILFYSPFFIFYVSAFISTLYISATASILVMAAHSFAYMLKAEKNFLWDNGADR